MISLVVMLSLLGAAAQQPARDVSRPPAEGTAVIAGVVTTGARPERPVRRARVMLGSPDHPHTRVVVSEDDGTFRFERLPPGRYTLGAAKPAYLPAAHGARESGRPGSAIVLRQGEALRLALHMDRGAVVTGTVFDSDGQPASGVSVDALRQSYMAGMRRLTAASTAVTNDRGEYRIFGLTPGEYFVSARPPRLTADVHVLSDREIRRALSSVQSPADSARPGATPAPAGLPAADRPQRVALAPVFYPGTTVAARAQAIAIGREEERHGIDVRLERVPVARVEGTVTAGGDVPRFTMVTLSPREGVGDPARGLPFATAGAGANRPFVFPSVPPGEYTVQARVMTPGPAQGQPIDPDAPAWASTDIVVGGEDIVGLSLVLQPPLRITGEVVFEGRPFQLPAAIDLTLPLERLDSRTASAVPRLRIEPGGRFTIAGILPGRYVAPALAGVRSPIGGWWLKSIVANGVNLLDRPLDLQGPVTNAVVTLADRASEISGTLRDAAANPLSHAHVIVFAADPQAWFYHSRRVAAAMTSVDGEYRVMNLPPGDYLAAPGADLHAGEWWDPSVLERLSRGASRIRLAEFENVRVDVTAR